MMKSRFLKVFIIFLSVLFLLGCEMTDDSTSSYYPTTHRDYAKKASSEDFIFVSSLDDFKIDEKFNGYTAYLVQCNLSSDMIVAEDLGWAMNRTDYQNTYNLNSRSLISDVQNVKNVDVLKNDGLNVSKIEYSDYDTYTFKKIKLISSPNARSANVNNSSPLTYPDTKTFFTPKSVNGSVVTVNVTATKKAEGKHCVIYLDNSDASGVTQNIIDEMASKFDSIFEKETKIFGSNLVKGLDPNGRRWNNVIYPSSSDKILILLHDINQDKQTEHGTFGRFYQTDLFTDRNSNKCEMFYVDTYFLQQEKTRGISYSTLVHEFQHLLNYVNKWLNCDADSDTWYNEMLSMLAEEIFQNDLGTSDEDSPKGRLQHFIFSPNYGFSDYTWDKANETNESGSYEYANSYAFGTYLAHNYGGIELVKKIAQNKSANEASITQALKALGYNETFETVFFKFAKVMLNTAEVTDDTISLNKTVDEYFKNIDLSKYSYYTSLVDAYYIEALENGKIEYENNIANPCVNGPAILKAGYKVSLFPYSMEIMKMGKVGCGFVGDFPQNANTIMFIALKME